MIQEILMGERLQRDDIIEGFGIAATTTCCTYNVYWLSTWISFRALFNHNPAMNAAGGVLGLVGGMVVETFLFIIRSSNLDSKQEVRSLFANSKLKKNQ
ncbi:hypothetical protein L6164_027398 [Bauhinia variegata]|uniref:Uncharacterized protein n=1 Tax=Bauhinia variegata TaxID=167791 RepID=A0ACB9LUF0_BAUVA|nr:hypothetical protein L6164_027398 [Bauhinia variegata]